ncbi:MAG: TolC family outer membrane protein [Betaproteobacteria bacterium]|nr:TolC family outer membrane protein [Betaproteobacteria bacterium]MDH3436981.1 TolC family outer membrane protein [Betaproteobacteria bacterium]
MPHVIASVSFAFLITVGCAAQGADLVQIYRTAQTSDAQYAAARATWAAGQERLPQGRAGLLPSVSISASTQYNDREIRFRDPTIPDNNATFNSNTASVSLSQPIYRPENFKVFEQAKTQVAQADAVLAQAAQDLILRVAQAYFDVLLTQDTVAFAQAQLQAIGQQLEQAKRNFEVGTATIVDTKEAQSRYDLTRAFEIQAKNEVEVRKRFLELIIGQPAPGLSPLGKRFKPAPPDPNNHEKWVSRAAEGNVQVKIAERSFTFATQEVERNRTGHLPTLDAFASYTDSGSGAASQTSVGSDTRNAIVGVQLAIPIYQGGSVSSKVREAIANAEKARQDLENARRTAELTARQRFLGVTSRTAQIQALEAALVSSESSLASTVLGQEVGVRTQVDVLNATQQVSETRRDLAEARYAYILALLQLKATAGTLTEADVVAVNSWLDK